MFSKSELTLTTPRIHQKMFQKIICADYIIKYLWVAMWWLEWVSEVVVGNNTKIFKTLSPSCPVNNGSLFLRCRTCNHPPNPHDLRGGPGWEGDFLPWADHPGCPLRRPPGSLQTTHSKAQEDSIWFALATQITKSTFSFHHLPCFPHPFSKRCALLRNQIKLCFVPAGAGLVALY